MDKSHDNQGRVLVLLLSFCCPISYDGGVVPLEFNKELVAMSQASVCHVKEHYSLHSSCQAIQRMDNQ
jgi:hypothetical protein